MENRTLLETITFRIAITMVELRQSMLLRNFVFRHYNSNFKIYRKRLVQYQIFYIGMHTLNTTRRSYCQANH